MQETPEIFKDCTAGVNVLNAVTLPIAGCYDWGWYVNFNGWYGFNQWIVDGNTYSNYFTHYTHNITP